MRRALAPLLFCLCLPGAHATPATPVDSNLPGVSIMSAAEWGSIPSDPAKARRQGISHITLHHQGETYPAGTDPIAYLRHLQSWSRSTKHWLDIPYHYIVGLDGKIYQGRPLEYAGDTNTEYDPLGHALIEVVGNFEEVEPNQAQLDAVADLMAALALKYHLSIDAIHGHKDYSAQTVCPGEHLYAYLQDGYFRRQVALRLARAASGELAPR